MTEQGGMFLSVERGDEVLTLHVEILASSVPPFRSWRGSLFLGRQGHDAVSC